MRKDDDLSSTRAASSMKPCKPYRSKEKLKHYNGNARSAITSMMVDHAQKTANVQHVGTCFVHLRLLIALIAGLMDASDVWTKKCMIAPDSERKEVCGKPNKLKIRPNPDSGTAIGDV